MALTELQREVCRLIAGNRIACGEAYVAGGAALGMALQTSRISQDVDLFHDTHEALTRTFASDMERLRGSGYQVEVLVDRPAYAEASVLKGNEKVLLQWTCDSAFRFFPLVEHPDFGLTLHPFDLATNKVLALIGRAEARDWVDIIGCHYRLQPLGYLVWAACGKDPALSPGFILDQAKRGARYTQSELSGLAFEGPTPSARDLACRWKDILKEAETILDALPADHAGACVLDKSFELYTGSPDFLARGLSEGEIVFHEGAIRGALPQLMP